LASTRLPSFPTRRSSDLAEAIHELERQLVGRDPFQIELLWQEMYRNAFWVGGPILTSAISGIEQALWDIKGKALGVPVYELLGRSEEHTSELQSPCNLVC